MAIEQHCGFCPRCQQVALARMSETGDVVCVWCGRPLQDLMARKHYRGRVPYDAAIQFHGLHCAMLDYTPERIAAETWRLLHAPSQAAAKLALLEAWVTLGLPLRAPPKPLRARRRPACPIAPELAVALRMAHETGIPLQRMCARYYRRLGYSVPASMQSKVSALWKELGYPPGQRGRLSNEAIGRADQAERGGALADVERLVAALAEDQKGVPQLQLPEPSAAVRPDAIGDYRRRRADANRRASDSGGGLPEVAGARPPGGEGGGRPGDPGAVQALEEEVA